MLQITGITLKKRHLYTTIAITAFFLLGSFLLASAQDDNAQTSELYKLQAAYHRAAAVRDPVNGDSPDTITERVRDVLSLFTADAVLYLNIGSAKDGYYLGNGCSRTQMLPCPPFRFRKDMVARWETRQLPDLDQKSDHRRSSSLVGKDFAASIAWRGDSDEA
jgi:hypothetical protein